MQSLRGTGVALITPFNDYQIDYPALSRCIEFVIGGGVDYIVALGSTGESATLSPTERRQVLSYTIEVVAGRVPVVAGNFGGNDTRRICDDIASFDFTGITAILSSSPEYNKPSQEGIFRHYQALASVSPVPLIVYNVPGRTASNVTADTTIRLSRTCPNICGIKEASADLAQGQAIIEGARAGFLVLSGDDPTALQLVEAGGHGVISVIANALPGLFREMIRSALDDHLPRARSVDQRLAEIHPLLYAEGNPAGIKGLLSLLGLCTPEVRLPLMPATPSLLTALHSQWQRVAVSNPEHDPKTA